MEEQNDSLRLKKQLCFPLYAAAKEIVRMYRPFLDDLDLTYTQYIAMMVLWEEKELSVKQLGSRLYLDSGTLTPLLKSLEQKGYVHRFRCPSDERVVKVNLTPAGAELEGRAQHVPEQMRACVCLTKEEADALYSLLYKLLRQTELHNDEKTAGKE